MYIHISYVNCIKLNSRFFVIQKSFEWRRKSKSEMWKTKCLFTKKPKLNFGERCFSLTYDLSLTIGLNLTKSILKLSKITQFVFVLILFYVFQVQINTQRFTSKMHAFFLHFTYFYFCYKSSQKWPIKHAIIFFFFLQRPSNLYLYVYKWK